MQTKDGFLGLCPLTADSAAGLGLPGGANDKSRVHATGFEAPKEATHVPWSSGCFEDPFT